jgi:hypothetical protein
MPTNPQAFNPADLTMSAKCYTNYPQQTMTSPRNGHRITQFGGRQIFVENDDSSRESPSVVTPMLKHAH